MRPTNEDGFLRSEAANPVFSLAHRSESRKIETSPSALQQALIKAYKRLETSIQKSQIIQQVLAEIGRFDASIDFERLREILQKKINAKLKELDKNHADVVFTLTPEGKDVTQEMINTTLFGNQTPNAKDYIDALLGYCAPKLFDTVIDSPFNYLTKKEEWSIATQFLLGMTNIYGVARGIIGSDTNFGRILDGNPNLCTQLADTLAKAQKDQADIEKACLDWVNKHATELKLKKPFAPDDIQAIKEGVAKRYIQIKDAPHFDEFFVLDTEKPGTFVIHQGSICTSFARFVNSPLLDLPQDLTQPLEKAHHQANSLSVTIHPLVQGTVEIDTVSMNNTALQALYERINTYKDPKLKQELLTQFKKERPDFKPQIDARQFLQHVAYGQQDEAESLLKNSPITAQKLLTAREIPFTDYSGRTFKCTAYEYAYWAKDTHMQRMLEKYMDDATKQTILKRVEQIEELVGDTTFKQPRGLTYTQKGKQYRSAHFDLTPLKQALKTYKKAYEASPKETDEDWAPLDALWIKVGLAQREVPAHIAQEYCHPNRSFAQVVDKPSYLDASKADNLVRQLKFYNALTKQYDEWFAAGSYEMDSGLGFSFAILRWRGGATGGVWAAGGSEGLDLSAIEAIDKARTEDLKQSLANLAAPSNLRVHQSQGS